MKNKRKRKNKSGMFAVMLMLAAACTILVRPANPSSLAKQSANLDIITYSAESAAESTPTPADIPAGAPVCESVMPEGKKPAPTPVSPITIDSNAGRGYGTVYVKNDTDYSLDVAAMLNQKINIRFNSAEPAVLIMHTHGTEAYTPDSTNNYTPTDTDRTTDLNYNVVRVGASIEQILNAKGIKTIHAKTLNDSPSYSGSYNRALDVVAQNMKENPSIKFVIDVHRDAMISKTGKKYKTVADINGRSCAQLMFVAGTDAGGLTHAAWRDNLVLMTKLQENMSTKHPGIMRPINIRAARFNQHTTTGSMLLEVGTSGNSLDEALYSAELFANVLAETLAPLKK